MTTRFARIASLCVAMAFAVVPRGSAQAVGLSPTSLNFGAVEAGQSSNPLNVVLTNTGSATLTISSIAFGGTDPQDFHQTNNCGTSVNAGAQCTIAVVFKPSRSGNRNASLLITDNANNSPQSVPVKGVGQTSPLAFSPQTLSFANQKIGTTSNSQTVTVTYAGTTPLVITSLGLSGQNASDFSQTNTCGTGLPAGGSCTYTVTFTPSAAWARSSVMVMNDNAQGNIHLVGVTGNGVSGGVASLSSSKLTFASQKQFTTSAPQSATLTNTGTAPLAINSVAVAGDYAQTNNCPASLGVGSSCTVNVTFTPTYSASRPGWVTINLMDPASLVTLNLAGTGTLPTPVAVVPFQTSVTTSQTVQFSATINKVQSSNVTWSVDGVVGGNSTSGTISSAGLYTPPPSAGTHTVTAANNANLSQTAAASVAVSGYAGTLMHHNDTYRSGQNNLELALTPGNVNKNQFGKLFSYPVDAQTYAEPLWVPNLTVNSQPHNVIYVVTENNSVYAFDADSAALNPNALWHDNLGTPIPSSQVEVGQDLSPLVGATATPVIDAANGILYVEARTYETTPPAGQCVNPNQPPPNYFVHRLHALSLTTGAEMPGSPVIICATTPGTGYDNVGGTIYFNTMRQHQRPALLLLKGTVFLGFGALEDIDHYHGWILGYTYNQTTGFTQTYVFNDTPNGQKGGIWQSGGGLLADSNGYIYAATGNGTFDANIGGPDYGTAFLKLSTSGSKLSVADYFTPFDQVDLNLEIINADLASAGPMLVPDQTGSIPHMAVACGKTGTLYLINRDNLGQYSATADNVVQAIYNTIGTSTTPTGNWGTPAFFNGQVYLQGIADPMKQYTLALSPTPRFSGNPMAVSPDIIGYASPIPVVSSNGPLNGIVWLVQDSNSPSANGILRAYDAANIAHELYNSNSTRDKAGLDNKFATPTVANGKVYVPGSQNLDVYGLLP